MLLNLKWFDVFAERDHLDNNVIDDNLVWIVLVRLSVVSPALRDDQNFHLSLWPTRHFPVNELCLLYHHSPDDGEKVQDSKSNDRYDDDQR